MKKYLPLYLRSLFCGLFLCMGYGSYASHIVGMDLSYSWVSDSTYKITLVAYGDCASGAAFTSLATATPQICIYNAAASVTSITLAVDAANSGINISPVCIADTGLTTCSGGTIIGIKKYTYSANYKVTGHSHYFRFIFDGNMAGTSAGRAASITNINSPGTSITQLVDTLDNTYHNNNSSPVLSVVPTPYYCLNNADTYNPGATDPDGDSLHFYLTAGLNNTAATCAGAATATNVTYLGTYSAAAPLSTSAFAFDPLNGQINFNPNVTQRSLVVYTIREYRNDTFIGTSQREMTFLVQTCTSSAPWGGISSSTGSGAVIDSTDYHICTNGGAFTLQMNPVEAAGTASITVTSSGLPSGSSVNVVNNGTPTPVVTFSWTATGPAAGTYTFYLVYKDNNCPIAGQSTYAFNITINSLAVITGSVPICVSSSVTLSNTTAGGTWSSSNANATVGSGTGIVTGVTAGTATISYSVGSCFVTSIVTVNPTPTAILGVTNECIGFTSTLSDAVTGGTWTSSTTGVATVGGSTGVVMGVSNGVTTISYALSDGCQVTVFDTVNTLPTAILGTFAVCAGASTTLTDATAGGTWTSSNANATIGSGSGTVAGVTAGTSTISYLLGTGCYITHVVTVNAQPGAINPAPATVCLGGTLTLTDGTAGGAWSSVTTSVATISTAGVVTGAGVGASVISYTMPTGCSANITVSVNTAPVAITPTSPIVCTGSTTNLTDATTGGVWSSSNANATVGTTGVVAGATAGTATISYSIGTCSSTVTISINTTPAAITPTPVTICAGGTATLTDATAGGVWSSTATGVATVAAGVVTATGIGTTTISYTLLGCAATTVATVNNAPVAITPATATVCTGSTTNLTDATTGGVWSSSNTNATVSVSGVVGGVTAGTATISYSIGTCSSTAIVTINTTPAAITPAPVTICAGGTATLTDATAGGVWSSTATGVATVAAGVVTAVGTGTTTISYTLAGCAATTVATVNNAPVAIVPATTSVCTGGTTNLTDATTGGVWSSSNTNATVSVTGVVTGVTVGTATITYAIGTCNSTATVTVNTGVAAISPAAASVCIGTTATLTDATGGGVWSSSSTNASVTGGVVTGVTTGTATISYTLGSCSSTSLITVSSTPSAISPATALVCVGNNVSMSDAVSGGVWSSSNTNATVSGGLVTGAITGTATISYAIGTCVTTAQVTVNPGASAGTITGPSVIVCPGLYINLTDATTGGVWTAGNANATVNTSGVVTGLTVGTDVITYTITSSCGTAMALSTVTISASASSGGVIGPLTVCEGSYDIYLDTLTGGTWSVINSNAVISAAGVLTAITAGPETVVYGILGACTQSMLNITIIPATTGAGTITGPTSICLGVPATLSDATAPGGTWSTTNSHATIGSGTGIVTGASAGLDTVIYSITTACGTYTTSTTVNVDASATPSPIGGPSTVCVASSSLLTDADLGGIWSSSNAHATVSSGVGLVTGVTAGIDTIKYTVTNGCGLGSTTKVMTVMPSPGAGTITGVSGVCPGGTITLSDVTAGGVWSSSNATASVGSTGIVTGNVSGVDTILYTITASCGMVSATKSITVNPLPDASTVLGPDSVCTAGGTITLLDFALGGVWSAGNANASVSSTGVVTGVSVGTDPISYAVTNACGTTYAMKIVSVIDIPSAGTIVGISDVCVGSAITLTDTAAGGLWLSSNANGTLIGAGIVSGVTVGIDSIFYVVTNMCGTNEARHIVNIDPIPVVPAITAPATQCVGTAVIYTDGMAGGVWSSSDATIATVDLASGNVTAVGSGVVNISYTVTNGFGCPGSAVATVTVIATPVASAIMGASSVCELSTIALSDTTLGGVWSSSDNTIGSTDASGNVTGVAAGVVNISYTVTNICGSSTAMMAVTVNALPVVSSIMGTNTECAGSTTTLSNTTSGGTWITSDNTIAAIDASSGLVTGVSAGTATIIYSLTNAAGCTSAVSAVNTVNPLPAMTAITGTTNECISTMTALTDATTGGIWSSSDNTIATVDGFGNVTGVAGGIVTIAYTVTDGLGCSAMAATPDTVSLVPVATATTGTMEICAGNATTLTNTTTGGVWTSYDNTIATVDASGLVFGVGAGTDYIFYTVSNACGSVTDTATMTIDALPSVAPITASFSSACVGTAITMSDATTGGVWTSSDNTIATVDGAGNVTSIAAGTATITYTVTNASLCTNFATYAISISPAMSSMGIVPSAATLCNGGTVNMHIITVLPGITYQWMIDGNMIAGATNSNYISDSAGGYTLAVNNGTCSETISGCTVSNQPNPTVSFNAPNVLFTGSFLSYQWYKDGVAITGATSSTYYETTNGYYTVEVTDINGCSVTSPVGYHITDHSGGGGGGGTTGVNNTANTNIRIYPNPATSILTVDAPVKVNVSLLGVDGKLLIQQADAHNLDISQLANGMYMIMVYDENNLLLTTSKFVKSAQ